MDDESVGEWPGKAEGVPRPPTQAELDDVSKQQGLIADEWAPNSAPEPGGNPTQ
ncbi:MAG: hypothetical protein RQ966_07705 [Acetobacteraceae bacterium]|nr:hypothetical protein [Acetobacteraceae bacterium]